MTWVWRSIKVPVRDSFGRWGWVRVREAGLGCLGPEARAVHDTNPLPEPIHTPPVLAVVPCMQPPRQFQDGPRGVQKGSNGTGGRLQPIILPGQAVAGTAVATGTCLPQLVHLPSRGPRGRAFSSLPHPPQPLSWPGSCCGRALQPQQGGAAPGLDLAA